MPPDQPAGPDSPLVWLTHSKADFVLAQSKLLPGGLYEHLCFHAQQAAEKAIKAVFLHYSLPFPFTHNLQVLIDKLPPMLADVDTLGDCTELNAYAVVMRYPSEIEPVTEEEWQRAVELAAIAIRFAERHVK
jgi:HEPN domain-containing protein